MNSAIHYDKPMPLRCRPPLACGLVRRSPRVALRGTVRTNADEDSSVHDTLAK